MSTSHEAEEVPAVAILLHQGPLAPYNYQIENPNRQLVFYRHGGDLGRRPRHADEEGSGWTLVDREHSHSKYWRGVVGTFIAHRTRLDATKGKAWHVFDWPDGYSLWVKPRPKGGVDYYLYGYEKGAFRSPVEFMFHAWFLHRDDENVSCKCKLCTRRPQHEINFVELGKEPPIPQPRDASPDEPDEIMDDEPDVGFPHSAIVDAEKRFKRIYHHDFRFSLHDVIDAVAPDYVKRTEDFLHRVAFRKGDLVWIRIPSIPSRNAETAIEWWPAIIDGWRRRRGTPAAKDYFALLLAVGTDQEIVGEENIIPYSAYGLSQMLKGLMDHHRPPVYLIRNPKSLKEFFPLPPANDVGLRLGRTWENALSAFSIAVRIAEALRNHYCPIEEWQFRSREIGEIQERYQGAWFGPERVWLGDLVRLKASRDHLREEDLGYGLLRHSSAASQRGLLLFITGIILLPNDGPDELTIAGSLYEEADLDYIDRQPRVEQLPNPPAGFHFRRLTPEGKEIRIPFQYIAGRYYDISSPRRRFPDLIDFSNRWRLEACAALHYERDFDVMPELTHRKRKATFDYEEASAQRSWLERWNIR